MKKEASVKIIPLGGLGYVGKNITLFEFGEEIIIVDCGIRFPTEATPGIDYIIPDFSYIVKNKKKVKALIVTHGHEDHIGAIPFLLQEVNVPIYATKLTIGLIESRLIERQPKEKPQFNEVKARDKIKIGKNFEIDFIKVNHSISDCVALAISTPIGRIIHTGDFKIDHSPVDGQVADLYRFGEFGEKGVLLLMADSTNAEVPGVTRSESVVVPKLTEIFSKARGRIICATFASSISRIQQILDVAQKYNRKVVISGITMQKNIEIAATLGYLTFKSDLIVDGKEASQHQDKKLVVICTGTQGEPMAALSRMANATHKHIAIKNNDTVIITASVIPGNEKGVGNIINSLMKLGAEVYYEQDEDIHVSGHASQEELKLILTLVKPKYYMPLHGEHRHLVANAKLAEMLKIKSSNIIVADSGDVLELTAKKFQKVSQMKLGEIFVDGQEIGDVENEIIKDRQLMSQEGIMLVCITLAERQQVQLPVLVTRGFMEGNNQKFLKGITELIAHQVNDLLEKGASLPAIKAEVKKSLKHNMLRLSNRDPLIDVIIQES